MTMKLKTETVLSKRILIVTNDSTVFTAKNKLATAFEMFEGRMTEVKKLVARLDTAVKDNGDKLCDVSFGVITTKYGFVPGNYNITGYDEVMSDKAGYQDCEERKQFACCRFGWAAAWYVPPPGFQWELGKESIEHARELWAGSNLVLPEASQARGCC